MKRVNAAVALFWLSELGMWAQEKQVHIGVLGLFHTKQLVIAAVEGKPFACGEGAGSWPVRVSMRLDLEGTSIRTSNAGNSRLTSLNCDNGQGDVAEFTVMVPGKISRNYVGRLEVAPQHRELQIVIAMDVETAVASIVAAESPPHAPMEALKAQAVATRSFLVAGQGRHHGFDFCDTTHCQFLRAPPAAGSPAVQATRATHGLVLAYKDQAFAAMYSASCGGRTHSLEELGVLVRDYPYYAVICDYCHRHPEKWVATISEADAANLEHTESSRLKLARQLGWKTIPGNSYSSRTEGGQVVLEGAGVGHGVGLCQRGGAAMARQGVSFLQILEHYFPNTSVKQR